MVEGGAAMSMNETIVAVVGMICFTIIFWIINKD